MCGIRKLVLICCRLIVEHIGTLSCVSVYAYDPHTRYVTDTFTLDSDAHNRINRVCLLRFAKLVWSR